MHEYLLSIIIPTKNRQYYCLNSVNQILDCYGDEVEIVVQDNSDDPSLESQIKKLKRDNVIYHYQGGVLSFVDNFDMAIQLASGRYLMLIGDDDGITSLALRVTKWAEQNGISSIKPSLSFVYFWPGSQVFKEDDNGVLNIYTYDGEVHECNPKKGVTDLLKKSCQNYLDSDLIKLYHGIVRRDLLDAIKEKMGRYVGGLSPDIYLSVALSLIFDGRAVSVNFPLSISGICTGSGSSQSATGEHTGKLEDAPHFRGHNKYDWDSRIPRFYSVETIWGDSAMAAIKDIDPDYEIYYKPETLTYRCLRKYPKFKDEIMDSYSLNGGSGVKLCAYACSRVLYKIFSKLKNKTDINRARRIRKVKSIKDAAKECEAWIKDNAVSFSFEEKNQI